MKETLGGFLMGVTAIAMGVVLSEASRTGVVKMAEALPKPKLPTLKKAPPPPPEPIPAPPGNPPPFEKEPETVDSFAVNYLNELRKSKEFSSSLEQQILEQEGGIEDNKWLEA